tara:strand:- start:2802 stop:3041 length:240 start_codon:yes stop_codon:yes gene_type:complete
MNLIKMEEIYYLDNTGLSQLTNKEDIEKVEFLKKKLAKIENKIRREGGTLQIMRKEEKIAFSGNISSKLKREILSLIYG